MRFLLARHRYQRRCDRNGTLRGKQSIAVADLRPGDCIKDLESQDGKYIDALPCSAPHTSELFAAFAVSEEELGAGLASKMGCLQRFASYAGRDVPQDAEFTLVTARMADSDRGILCFGHQTVGTTTGSLKR
ncbi:hypothetical protein AB0M36_35290 [Actinoplanes sp. NPDC051346]|uniref:hypothetical protein n=1 Tax=Actinoplanes sp. NPDC051346 TaxID=3155048 RepID=UPI003425D28A